MVVGRNWILIQFPPPPQTVLHYRHYSRFCGIKQRRSGREIDPWLVFVHVANGSWFVQFNCWFGACFVRLKAQSKNRNSTWGIKFNASVFSSVPTAIYGTCCTINQLQCISSFSPSADKLCMCVCVWAFLPLTFESVRSSMLMLHTIEAT